MNNNAIRIENAKQNNLKSISIEIPFGQLVCVTGVSGSGKSTLVEKCIGELAEYRHLELSGKSQPNFYEEGSHSNEVPYVSYIKQGTLKASNRSVVGTAIGIIQKLRELIIPHAEVKNAKGYVLKSLKADELAQWCHQHHKEAEISLAVCLEHMVLGPAARYIKPALQTLQECKFKVMEADIEYEHTDLYPAQKYLESVFRSHKDIYAVITNLDTKQHGSFQSKLDQILKEYPGQDLILVIQKKLTIELIHLNEVLLSPTDSKVYFKPTEKLLSFNSLGRNSGQCKTCNGTGRNASISHELVFPSNNSPIDSGGLGLPFNEKTREYLYFAGLCDEIRGVLIEHKISINTTWDKLKSKTQDILINGSSESFQPYNSQGKPKGKIKPFVGIIQRIQNKLDGTSSAAQGLSHLHSEKECSACNGTRLNYAAHAVYFANNSFPDLLNLSFSKAESWLHKLLKDGVFKEDKNVITALEAICKTCVNLGLGHLQLSRATTTLSGGEAQRLRIARGLWARLDNACYVLDEPTRGLHSQDIVGVVDVFNNLRTSNNCVLLVEHNPLLASHADRIIELGPEGGKNGGEVIYDGQAVNCPMLKKNQVESQTNKTSSSKGWITVKNATLRTIHNQSFKLPLGQMTCFTGISGSGKTTLLAGILLPALERLQSGVDRASSKQYEVSLKGVSSFHLIYLSQTAIGGSYRSRILSHLGLADTFRDWFCEQSNAEVSGLSSSHFSSNTQEGQCETCEGRGYLYLRGSSNEICPSCCGSGFNAEVSFVSVDEFSIIDWMNSSLQELSQNIKLPENIRQAAILATDLGLGHLNFGRPIPTLSGGECQRLRVVKALLDASSSKKGSQKQHLIVVMDEPSAGLHPKDVQKLINTLKNNITGVGHTLLLIEHNLQLIKTADWIVDMGPGSGSDGGKILFNGSKDEFLISNIKNSPTFLAIKDLLSTKPIKLEPSNNTLEFDNSLSSPQKQEMVGRFKHYLQGESENPDDSVLSPKSVIPAYCIKTNDLSDHTFARTSGIDVNLFRLFSNESSSTFFRFSTSADQIKKEALKLLNENWRIGWFPSPRGNEVAALPDTVVNIKNHLKYNDGEWFDGKTILKKPLISKQVDLQKIRLLISSKFDAEEALRRAFALGKGWITLVSPETGEIRDFTTRTIDPKHLRLGSRWQVPHLFDPMSELYACPLCKGKGIIETVDRNLIFKNETKSLESDDLFQKYALEVLKLSRRQELLPAAKRLEEAGIIDLNSAVKDMDSPTKFAFWFGYPYKGFLKTGGKKETLGDWFRWQGINKYILLNMWKCSSREWAESVNKSKKDETCPECNGTGLGWEAQQRRIDDVSMQDIYLHFTAKHLQTWLKSLKLKSDGSLKIQNELLLALNDITKLVKEDFRLFELQKNLPESIQQIAICKYLSNNALNKANVFLDLSNNTDNQKFKNALAKSNIKSLITII